jgi:hypothetical protein
LSYCFITHSLLTLLFLHFYSSCFSSPLTQVPSNLSLYRRHIIWILYIFKNILLVYNSCIGDLIVTFPYMCTEYEFLRGIERSILSPITDWKINSIMAMKTLHQLIFPNWLFFKDQSTFYKFYFCCAKHQIQASHMVGEYFIPPVLFTR